MLNKGVNKCQSNNAKKANKKEEEKKCILKSTHKCQSKCTKTCNQKCKNVPTQKTKKSANQKSQKSANWTFIFISCSFFQFLPVFFRFFQFNLKKFLQEFGTDCFGLVYGNSLMWRFYLIGPKGTNRQK